MADSPGVPFNVATLSLLQRLRQVLTRTLPKLAPAVRAQLAAIIEPKSLAIIAGVLGLWVGSHAFGVGEAIDIILSVVGVFTIGLSVFDGVDHLFRFAEGTYTAKSEQDLDIAADHLAQAISILGIQAVLAVLFRSRGRAARVQIQGQPRVGATLRIDPAPPETPGLRYGPSTSYNPAWLPGQGETSAWGDITLATRGNATDQAITLFHERVHQFLTPKLYILRNYRVVNRTGSYAGSSLWRYLEELVAETIAQVGVQGFKKVFVGLRFPVQNGYVYLIRSGSDPSFEGWSGRGVLPEGAGLVATGTAVGFPLEFYFKGGQTDTGPTSPTATGQTR